MLLVKTSWIEGGENLQQAFQLIEISMDKDQEQLRQQILAHLQALGRKNGAVEFFDPNNVPPGTIPADASVIPGESPFNA